VLRRFGAAAGTTLFDAFTSLSKAQVLDLSMNSGLGDEMIENMCQIVGGGFPWNLRALWCAYCNVSMEGIRKLRGLVRSGHSQIRQLVVSGACRQMRSAGACLQMRGAGNWHGHEGLGYCGRSS
jgi:hypothetical protein